MVGIRARLAAFICVWALVVPAYAEDVPQITAQEKRQALENIEKLLIESGTRRTVLEDEISALAQERERLAATLTEGALNMRALEQKVTALEGSVEQLRLQERTLRVRLMDKREVFANVLGAASAMGRSPPPALFISPDDAKKSVRTAMLLEALLPDMRQEIAGFVQDLSDLERARDEQARQTQVLQEQQAQLIEDKRRLDALLSLRTASFEVRQKDLSATAERAAQLTLEARTLRELLNKLENESAKPSAELSKRQKALQGLSVARGQMPLPVVGDVVKVFGATDGLGGSERGITLRAKTGAIVLSPLEGQVVFAGPFRSYGRVLILNAGGGYHILLAGMERISVEIGQFVLAGEPLGSMMGAIGDAEGHQLYVEFRKNGQAFDPKPWLSFEPKKG